MTDITTIISGVLFLVSAIITVFAIPFIKERTTAEQRNRIQTYIEAAVSAAEILFPSVDGIKYGKEKLEYVATVLQKQGITFNVDDITDEIRVMIESTVENFFGE